MQTLTKKLGSLQLIIFLLMGSMLGFSISIIAKLPNRALLVVLLGISFPFLAFIIGNMRRFLLATTAAVLPIQIDVNFMHVFENQAGAHTLGISLQDVFVILLLILWLIELATSEEKPFRFHARLTIPAILYIEAAMLTMLWAPRLDLAFLEVVRMIKVFILYFVLANQIRDKRDLKLVAWALVFSIGFEGVIALLQTLKGGTLGLDFLGEAYLPDQKKTKYWRVMGTLGHPNRLAMYLEMLLPLVFGMWLIERKGMRRLLVIGVFGLGVMALIMTGSRGAWISFFEAMFVLFFFLVKNRQMRLSSLLATALIAIILISGVALFFTDMIEHRLYGDDHGSAMSRIPMIQIALNLIQAHPLGGVGINNYQEVMRKYNDTILGRRFRSIPRPVHNMYLLVAGETGVIGLSMMLWLLFVFVRTLIQNTRGPDRMVSILNAAILSGLFAMCLHGMVDKHPPGGYPLFYVLLAMAASSRFIKWQSDEAERQDDE